MKGSANPRTRIFSIGGLVLAWLGLSDARAADLILIHGQGDEVGVTAAALRMPEWKAWSSGDRWRYALAPEWQVGFWHPLQSGINETSVVDGSVTGVLTIRSRSTGMSPYYMDVGFGLHMLSHSRISDERNFGSSFQFGEFRGWGADFGERRAYSLAARVQHVSNGGIKKPNPGVTFMQFALMYRF
jgi:lipid A 3-O-deacylase